MHVGIIIFRGRFVPSFMNCRHSAQPLADKIFTDECIRNTDDFGNGQLIGQRPDQQPGGTGVPSLFRLFHLVDIFPSVQFSAF